MDGATCSEFDQYVCFTPNASIEWKASQFDPQNKGYVITVNQKIVLAGLVGDAFTGKLSGTAQVGTGLAYNGHEASRSERVGEVVLDS